MKYLKLGVSFLFFAQVALASEHADTFAGEPKRLPVLSLQDEPSATHLCAGASSIGGALSQVPILDTVCPLPVDVSSSSSSSSSSEPTWSGLDEFKALYQASFLRKDRAEVVGLATQFLESVSQDPSSPEATAGILLVLKHSGGFDNKEPSA